MAGQRTVMQPCLRIFQDKHCAGKGRAPGMAESRLTPSEPRFLPVARNIPSRTQEEEPTALTGSPGALRGRLTGLSPFSTLGCFSAPGV